MVAGDMYVAVSRSTATGVSHSFAIRHTSYHEKAFMKKLYVDMQIERTKLTDVHTCHRHIHTKLKKSWKSFGSFHTCMREVDS
jgi:hypothetical protein